MDLDGYQEKALRTVRALSWDDTDDDLSLVVPMLGLAGETGQLLSEYKKHLRDRDAHQHFKHRVSEELGDILWYIANVASQFDLTLNEVAANKLARAAVPSVTEHPASLDLNGYQKAVLHIVRPPSQSATNDELSLVVPMLELAGETGRLLSDYKKHLRDRDAHFRYRVLEELGDLLCYIANVASKFDFALSKIAANNLAKVRARFMTKGKRPLRSHKTLPEGERLPRRFEVELYDIRDRHRNSVRVSIDGVPFGAELTDNTYDSDGYRFHDVFHLAYAAVLRWSPVTRALLRRKRKSSPIVDEVEDGGRAAVIEEGIAALAFGYASRHEMLDGVSVLDFQLLRTIKDMTSHLEVRRCTPGEWEEAILQGFKVWRIVRDNGGGRVDVDLSRRRIGYLGPVKISQLRLPFPSLPDTS